MDEDDSQDELVNHSASQSKGKRAAMWAISDDSDDAGSDEEGESESGEDEEGEHLDGEEDEDEDDDEDGEEEEDDGKPEEEACAGTSADHVELSSDEEAEKCPICLHSINRQPVATPESCEHYFCLDCILEWSKNANSCPIDRVNFKYIYLRTCYGGKVQKMITVQKPVKQCQQDTIDPDLEETSCEVCGASDREDRLLLCDGCDAGYHMECLTPPLDAVPVEEWFCPECRANNRQSRGSAEEISDSENLPSTAHAASRSRSHVAGPTRAIARTQHSERVRANVNRHRITQARTQEFAPTYLIRSTWLDETINAVVAGLNSAMYVRDLTPRATSTHRRKNGKARKGKRTSSKTKKGKAASTGTRRRKRKGRRTKSRKKPMMKKTATTRSRIANSLGIVKDKKSSSLPTVYQPSESTLSNMRADIGAASLSIYGDPFDLDPFVDREDIQHGHDSSLLEAKRRGISRSAFRSHQPVARPVSLSRRSVSIPQVGGVVEAAPVPDLLGSILSGQSMLLMDSSDVVINRDGSLKATKPMSLTTTLKSDYSKSSSSGDADLQDSPGILPDHVDGLGSSESLLNGHLSPSSSHLSPIASTFGHNESTFHSHVPPRGSPSLLGSLPNEPNRPNQRMTQQIINGVREHTPDFTFKSRTPSQSHSGKAPTKPMWVDVSVLPRIPKIKRESSVDDAPSKNGTSANNRRTGSSSSSGSSSSTNSYGVLETGINSLAGDKERRHSVDQQHGRTDSQRSRSEGAGSSAGFSGSFSSSSSSHANHQRCSSSSSTSVSFRISSSGNSWHSRRLNITSMASSGANLQEQCKGKDDDDEEERKRQLHRDKQKLLASRSIASNNIYDPFNPTESDLSSSSDEGENTNVKCSSRFKEKSPRLGKEEDFSQSKKGQEKVEKQSPRSQEKPGTTTAQEMSTQELKYTKENVTVKKESRFKDFCIEKQNVPLKSTIKTEPESDEGETLTVKHEDNRQPVQQRWDLLKIKEETATDEEAPEMTDPPKDNHTSSASSSSCSKKQEKTEIKTEPHTKSPSKDLSSEKKSSKKPSKEQRPRSSSAERNRRHGHPEAKPAGGCQKEKDRVKLSRRSRSKERRRTHMVSDSSQSKSPDKMSKKRRRSRSQSKEKRRSRSRSSSTSRERSRSRKHKQTTERNDDKEERRRTSKDKKRDWSRAKSRSRSRSRSREKKHGRTCSKSRSRSRSRSREKRKDHARYPSSRDKVESYSKEKKRHRSRSSSREKRKATSSVKSQKTSDSNSLSTKDKKTSRDKKKDESSSHKAGKPSRNNKPEPPSSSISQIKKERKKLKVEEQATAADTKIKTNKEIKKEICPSLDMFEDKTINKLIKKEETDIPVTVTEGKDFKQEKSFKEENLQDAIKTEICESDQFEAKSPERCHSNPVLSDSTMSPNPPAVSTPSPAQPQDTSEEPNSEVSTVTAKQEVHQPSDSDDDFNIDVMLDSLGIKLKSAEGTKVKQEKEENETKSEGEQAPVGAKSKTHVKRVTWNIQEPEGPQPEKSASKVALYKLKLKQEGLRRPSSAAPSSSQDLTGTVTVGDLSKTGVDPQSSSGSDSKHRETSEADDGDVFKKDKQYLKKLHMQERAIEEVKLAIKPFYQKRDINKDEYKEILRKAVQKVCHSKSGEINPVKVGNLVKAYVDKYKHARKHRKGEDSGRLQAESMRFYDSP